jgi:hypothetical protein
MARHPLRNGVVPPREDQRLFAEPLPGRTLGTCIYIRTEEATVPTTHASSCAEFGPAGDPTRPALGNGRSRTLPPPSPELLRRFVELALRAPSIHNTQPWRWRISGVGLELHSDRTRQLRLADPLGRELTISCGAALHHLQVVARALGWETDVDRLPDGPASSVVARIQFSGGERSEEGEADLKAIADRCTDRRRFTSWPVPDEQLQHLAQVAAAKGVHAVPLIDVSEKFRTELLVGRAVELQSTDQRYADEQQEWVDHSTLDGIPSTVLPLEVPTENGDHPTRFTPGLAAETERVIEGSDGLVVLCSGSDDPASWLSAGEGLSALWLMATSRGLSVVPLSQVIDVEETRQALRQRVLGGLTQPLILVRIGWQSISRSQLPRTSRRPVGDVLDLP